MGMLGMLVLAVFVSPARASIFEYLPPADVYPACLKTVASSSAHMGVHGALVPDDIEPVCERLVSSAPGGPHSVTTAISADCAELSGRMEEASKSGFLGDGREFCIRLLKEIAREKNVAIEAYTPQGETSLKIFCSQISDSAFLSNSPCDTSSKVNATMDTQSFAARTHSPVKDLSAKSLRQNFGEIMNWGDQ